VSDVTGIERVQAVVHGTAEPFDRRSVVAPALRWGLLFDALDAWNDRYICALELMYEGYLLHYRESRVVLSSAGDLASGLLAGDVFYARGLRQIAAAGDIDAVVLLTRLMSTCSVLRSIGAPFEADDVLWASATAGLVALSSGVSPADASRVFDQVDAELGRGAAINVAALAIAAVPRLRLVAPALLLAELKRAGDGATVQPRTTRRDRR
jgi:hypothetical protein